MAIITLLLSWVARQANSIVQAVFGWSITALFGRLQRRRQIVVTFALVLSLAWPLFVVGAFAPAVAAWAIAFVPLHHWISDLALRLIWLGLALLIPVGVGALVRYGAGPRTRNGLAGALLRGYPITIGFFAAFVVTVVTVPVVKIASIVRRWSDEHVYVQPREGAYDDVIACVVEACRRAGLEPVTSDAPRSMVLATAIMKKTSRGAVAPFVAQKLRRVTADGLELYLYPGDLLLRGTQTNLPRVRAMLTATSVDARAYIVDSDAGKALQDLLGHISDRLDHGASSATVAGLADTYRQMLHADISFDEWIVLENLARKLERRMIAAQLVEPEHLPIDRQLETVADGRDVQLRAASGEQRLRESDRGAHSASVS